jgi:hypothetical protein
MIDDLDRSLEAFLRRELAADHPDVRIAFDAIDAAALPVTPLLRVILYDVRENRERRNLEPMLDRRTDPPSRRPAPLPVDCSYAITAWARDGALAEHRLLGDTVRALARSPVLPADVLQGALAGLDAPPAARLQGGSTPRTRRLSRATGARPMLRYTVTVSLPLFDAEPVTLVTAHVVRTLVRDAATGGREE